MTYSKTPVLCALLLTTACGGASTSDSTGFDAVLGLAAEYDAQVADPSVQATQRTSATDFPASGSASFTGVMQVTSSAETAANGIVFVGMGQTTLELDFAADTVTGQADHFFEVPVTNGTVTTDALTGTPVDGELAYTLMAEGDGINFFEGDVTGQLTTAEGTGIAVDTEISGSVMGAEGQSFRAVTLGDAAFAVDVFALKD